MANAPVLKTGVRKDLGVRIPRPPRENGNGLALRGHFSFQRAFRRVSDRTDA